MTVAGSDSGGGAGIQADLRAFQSYGVYGATAITAVTAQNPSAVRSVAGVDPTVVGDQISMVFEAYPVAAVKTGMLFSRALVEGVAEALERVPAVPLVIDPVMVATSGARLLAADAESALIERCLPLARVVTPNLPEAAVMAGIEPTEVRDVQPELARELSERFGCAVFLKGGHDPNEPSRDCLWCEGEGLWLESPAVPEACGHGAGCSLSAALAAGLALDLPLVEAARRAKAYVYGALRSPTRVSPDVLAMWPEHAVPVGEIEVAEIGRAS